jgi:hypothetical protein
MHLSNHMLGDALSVIAGNVPRLLKELGMATVVNTPRRTYVAAFDLGDIVYMKVRDEPIKGMVASIVVRPAGVLYYVQWADCYQEGGHYEMELTAEAPL